MAEKEQSFKERLKGRMSRIQKPEKKRNPIKKDHSKGIAFLVWSMLGTIVFLSILTILLSVNTRSALNDINAHLFSDEETKEDSDFSVEGAKYFLAGFINEYVNVNSEPERIEERKNNLKSYMVQSSELQDDTHPLYDLSGLKGERILNESTLFDVKEKEAYKLFQYRVKMMNLVEWEEEVEVEKDDGDDDKKTEIEIVKKTDEKEQTLLLNIPVVSENGAFAVAAAPYFSEVYSLKGEITEENEENDQVGDEYTGEELESLQAFLVDFFERYATEPKEELSYIMAEPESLNGAFVLDELLNVKVYQTETGFKVNAEVRFYEEMINMPYVIDAEMDIENREGVYYVKKMDFE
ncbi:conjugal transfer protein [Shouchella clausii]|uniref:conjugal transfer protein n=1 Tax=Shouchella clausii TaxID=79880 RepID=UPI0026F42579|nr:conjugal transfer protein [Shouchella clausii]MDO7284695.1 conjugal transfer protein [Shouchella clausii]MDO7304790.1 conjugal transfer protein [Shouchella clausii]